jgi:hypothetical protein
MRYLFGVLSVCAVGVASLAGCSGTPRWTPGQCEVVVFVDDIATYTDAPDGTDCIYLDGTPGVCVAGSCERRCAADVDCTDFRDCTTNACDPTTGLCSYATAADGSLCAGGTCQDGECMLTSSVLPCTDQGIRNAVAAGGGPYTFACDGPTTVTTEAEIPIDTNVILDGGGKLTLDGNDEHRIFAVSVAVHGIVAELRGFTMTHGTARASDAYTQDTGGGVNNAATLTLRDCAVTSSAATYGGGIYNSGTLTLVDSSVSNNRAEKNGGGINGGGGTVFLVRSTVTGNSASKGGGILGITINLLDSTVSNNSAAQGAGLFIFGTNEFELDPAIAVNSTLSGNAASAAGGGVYNDIAAKLILTQTTVSDNSAPSGSAIFNNGSGLTSHNESSAAPRSHPGPTGPGVVTVSSSVISGRCATQSPAEWHSGGHNIESIGDTCGFDQATDQVNVTADALALGPLQDNGGPTMTHALLPGSVAIDVIPEAECLDADGAPLTIDQRGFPRDSMCDVGAFEVQP